MALGGVVEFMSSWLLVTQRSAPSTQRSLLGALGNVLSAQVDHDVGVRTRAPVVQRGQITADGRPSFSQRFSPMSNNDTT